MIEYEDTLVRAALDELQEPLPEFDDGWPDVLLRAEHGAPRRPVSGSVGLAWIMRRRRVTVAAGLLVAVAIAALVVVSPGRTGPSLIERAAAAISPADGILHLAATEHAGGTVTRIESWALGDPIQALRISRTRPSGAEDWSITATSSGYGPPYSTDGTGSSWVRGSVVGYCPHDRTLRTAEGISTFSGLAPIGALPGFGDPALRLRTALASGALHEDGTSTLDGQTVVKLTGSVDDLNVTYLVQPASLLPGRLEWTDSAGTGDNAVDFTIVEHLPATPQNRLLLDVSTQHPGARVVAAQATGASCS